MKHLRLLGLVGVVATLTAMAAAQSGTNTGSAASSHSQSKSDEASPSAGPHICFADDLVGMSVVSPEGEKLGKIEDVVVHPGGEVAYAVLSFGGFLGMGDKLFAIPWKMLKPQHAEHSGSDKSANKDKSSKDSADRSASSHKLHGPLVLAVEKERLKNAPGFDKDNWPTMANADWAASVDKYYGSSSASHADSGHPVEADAPRSTVIWRLSELKGVDVESPDKTKLGDIKDVAIDMHGRASFVVLSVGGTLGMGGHLVATPWDALRFSQETGKDKKLITLSITKERLEQAPQVKEGKENQAEMCDPTWISKVYDFYSIQPYWHHEHSSGSGEQEER
jgi:sporulation protein YlmC with PRC-barrel domain